MVANIIKAKSQNMFDLYDADGDGVITVNDFQHLADQFVSQFRDAEPGKIQAVRDQYTRLWEELAQEADTDKDGQVTRQEFASVLSGATAKSFDATVGGQMAEFEPADTDGDGYLDRQELTRLMKGYGVEAAEVGPIMTILDKNGDGRISRQEYYKAVRDFYTGTDAKSPVATAFATISAI